MPKPREIRTQAIYPPIPTNAYDWQAWFDGTNEDGEVFDGGWGATQQEAIDNLLEQEAEKDEPEYCGRCDSPAGEQLGCEEHM